MATCTGTTVRGKPCSARPLKGTKRCAAHPLSPGSTRFGSPAQAREAGKLGGRPALPKPTDLARQLIEEHVIAVLAPHFKTLGYEIEHDDDGVRLVERDAGGAKLYGTSKGGQVIVSTHDDLAAHMAAAEKLLDRTYGRPKQATELSGPGGGPVSVSSEVDLSKLSDDELVQLRDMLGRAGSDAPPDS